MGGGAFGNIPDILYALLRTPGMPENKTIIQLNSDGL